MKITIDFPWKRYALIAELAKNVDTVSPQFSKTALQKLVFLLQEVYGVDCGYEFRLYSYGPFDSTLLGDLDTAELWGCVRVKHVNDTLGGYKIEPGDKVDSIRDKASAFLDDPKTIQALEHLVQVYGGMTAKDLELRATTVYVAHSLDAKGKTASEKEVCRLVGQIKPKFSPQEISKAVTELSGRGHIALVS